jgi:DNA-directed RNA polymerase specialized sigma24 family protein
MQHQIENGLEHTMGRAFHTVHLLTANIPQAQNAVLEAIDLFDPDDDGEETLFRYALRAGVQAQEVPRSDAGFVPAELQSVLNLPRNLRHCFVLRFLAGLSRQDCARLLQLNTGEVDQYSCTALQRLAGSDVESRS